MVKTEREYREDICQVGRLVFQKGWVAANDGNITIRMDAERILATPTGVCKGLMHPDDLIIVDMKGNKISGRAERTSEIAMHTTVYGLRPDIKAVVRAHPTGGRATGRSEGSAAHGSGQTAGFADPLRGEGQKRRGAELPAGGRGSGHEQLRYWRRCGVARPGRTFLRIALGTRPDGGR